MLEIDHQALADRQGNAAQRVMIRGAALLIALMSVAALQAKPAVIVHKGHSSYVIVTPDDTSPTVDYAAKELQSLNDRVTQPQPARSSATTRSTTPCTRRRSPRRTRCTRA